MNTVYICGYYRFPHGSAGANYVQHLGHAFYNMGKKVVLVTNICDEEFGNESYKNHFHVIPYSLRNKGIGRIIDNQFGKGKCIKTILKSQNIDKSDIIIAYSQDSEVLRAILKIGHITGAQTGACLVEWFVSKDYRKGFFDRQYRSFSTCFYHLNKKLDFLFPISKNIEKYYKATGNIKTIRIPCLSDCEEFFVKSKNFHDKYIFVYPGNGRIKDSLNELLFSLIALSDNELSKIQIHLSGITEQRVKDILGEKYRKQVKDVLIYHKWMKYSQLVDLYQEAHYLLLPRPVNKMTISNFPSKVSESLVFGVVPICSKVGDYTEEYVEDGKSGLILEGNSVETICNGIRRAINKSFDEYLIISNGARELAQTKLDYHVFTERLKNL